MNDPLLTIGRVAIVIATLAFIASVLAGCAPVYYEETYYQPRRYYAHHHDQYRYGYRDRRFRDESYFQTDQHGVVDEYGQGWARCRVGYGRRAWCRVD